ncbi:MAG: hypothetical protein IPK82_39085 [Polyangiaceae bacterium]|nr:hypothetical protein [Polyangiaceae bacterium]
MSRWISALFAATGCALWAMGCGTKEEAPKPAVDSPPSHPSGSPSDAPTSLVSALPTASPIAQQPLHFRVAFDLPAASSVFWVRGALVVCETGCLLPEKTGLPAPRTWLVTRDKMEEDETLWPERAYFGHKREKIYQLGNARALFWGAYPNDMWARIDHGYDRGGIGQLQPVARSGKIWVDRETAWRPDLYEAPPRHLDDALLRAPAAGGWYTIVHGGKAPPVLVEKGKLHRWVNNAWVTTPAPWEGRYSRPRADNGERWAERLANGTTVVAASNGTFCVSATGEITPIVVDGKPELSAQPSNVYIADSGLWVLTPSHVLFASDDTAGRPAPHELRVPYTPPKPVQPVASAASAQPSAAASSVAPVVEMPMPVKLTDKCTTPFVILATHQKRFEDYPTVRRSFEGHSEWQDDLVFVEFQRAGVVYLGAQAKTPDLARKVADAVTTGEPLLKPQLTCLDALSHIPDRYSPPVYGHVWGLNLTTGATVNFLWP